MVIYWIVQLKINKIWHNYTGTLAYTRRGAIDYWINDLASRTQKQWTNRRRRGGCRAIKVKIVEV